MRGLWPATSNPTACTGVHKTYTLDLIHGEQQHQQQKPTPTVTAASLDAVATASSVTTARLREMRGRPGVDRTACFNASSTTANKWPEAPPPSVQESTHTCQAQTNTSTPKSFGDIQHPPFPTHTQVLHSTPFMALDNHPHPTPLHPYTQHTLLCHPLTHHNSAHAPQHMPCPVPLVPCFWLTDKGQQCCDGRVLRLVLALALAGPRRYPMRAPRSLGPCCTASSTRSCSCSCSCSCTCTAPAGKDSAATRHLGRQPTRCLRSPDHKAQQRQRNVWVRRQLTVTVLLLLGWQQPTHSP
jgi:hypothetical protein